MGFGIKKLLGPKPPGLPGMGGGGRGPNFTPRANPAGMNGGRSRGDVEIPGRGPAAGGAPRNTGIVPPKTGGGAPMNRAMPSAPAQPPMNRAMPTMSEGGKVKKGAGKAPPFAAKGAAKKGAKPNPFGKKC